MLYGSVRRKAGGTYMSWRSMFPGIASFLETPSEESVCEREDEREITYAGHSLDGRHDRIFRRIDRLRTFLRPREIGGFLGHTVSHYARHQRRDHGLSVLRAASPGEILK